MPEQDVRGKSLLDLLWEQLVQFVDDVQYNGDEPDRDHDGLVSATAMQEWAEARGRAHAMAVAVALVTNPYHPDVAVIKDDAMERWELRQGIPDEPVRKPNERVARLTPSERRLARQRRRAARNG